MRIILLSFVVDPGRRLLSMGGRAPEQESVTEPGSPWQRAIDTPHPVVRSRGRKWLLGEEMNEGRERGTKRAIGGGRKTTPRVGARSDKQSAPRRRRIIT
jgi:hypothetical protein